jgi:8-oxo-dGTP diphosphatase
MIYIEGKMPLLGEAMKSNLTTLCYLERDGKYLMMHRVKKTQDVNHGKWIGVGGHFEGMESPEECMLREVWEETGLTPTAWEHRGVVTFAPDNAPLEYMFLFTITAWEGTLHDCEEGNLAWVPIPDVTNLPLWEGDRIFLRLMQEGYPFFSLKLEYQGDALVAAALNGKPYPLS